MSNSILIRNISHLTGIIDGASKLVKGNDMGRVQSISDAWVLVSEGIIQDFGSMLNVPERADHIIDATGASVFPCWCDSHTHIVFAAGREGEFVDRIKGKSYEEIAAAGGGILNSANNLRQMSEDLLYEKAYRRLQEVISTGTGAIEIKSGYGLTKESELKMLRVIRRLRQSTDVTVKATFLGAHAVPAEYKENRADYIHLIINEMIPEVAGEGLADYCDVFCDKGFFTVEETDQILTAAARYGLKAKIHANELAVSGGVQVGIKNNAVSVDHLEATTQVEIDALKNASTIPTLLPSVSFFLNIDYAPARAMIDQGLGIAIASDYNPGSSPSGNIPLLMAIACNNMRITPTEAFNAVTINGACAMELEKESGSISKAKSANLIISRPGVTLDSMVYAFGSDHIDRVMIRGKLI
jgi:imidazolonepropionase